MNPKLVAIIPKLIRLGLSKWRVREQLKRYRHLNRSCQLILYDDSGETKIWIGVEDGEVQVRLGEYPATTTVRMHTDLFIDIVKGRTDFRTALWHGAIEVEAHDGRPWAYHAMLWAGYWDVVTEMLR